MDVHPPHEPIHSWRDFFVHLITITIGLLIALSLEGLVEWNHHRNLVKEARQIIREEMEANRLDLAKNLSSIHADEERISGDLKVLLSLRSGQKVKHGALEYAVSWSSFSESGWKTAQTTGALTYVDFKLAQDLADVYTQQEFASSVAVRIYSDQLLAISPLFITGDPNLMTPQEIQLALQRSADVLLNIKGLEQILRQLDRQYTDELKKV